MHWQWSSCYAACMLATSPRALLVRYTLPRHAALLARPWSPYVLRNAPPQQPPRATSMGALGSLLGCGPLCNTPHIFSSDLRCAAAGGVSGLHRTVHTCQELAGESFTLAAACQCRCRSPLGVTRLAGAGGGVWAPPRARVQCGRGTPRHRRALRGRRRHRQRQGAPPNLAPRRTMIFRKEPG